MNLSEYIVVLAVAAVAVVFAQQSDNKLANETISVIKNSSKVNLDADVFSNATLFLESTFISGIKTVAKSQDIITNAISKAKDLLIQNPKAAKNEMQQAFQAARTLLLSYAIPTATSHGSALELSNDGARPGLNNLSISLQNAAFSVLNALTAAEVLLNGAEGNANQVLFESCLLAVQSGYAGCYNNFQIAIQEGTQGLRDAQSKPLERHGENRSCESTVKDPEILQALRDINEAANNATENGSNGDLVEELKEELISSLCDYVNTTTGGTQTAIDIKSIAVTDPAAAKIAYFKLSDKYTDTIQNTFSNIYCSLGAAAFKSGNLTSTPLSALIMAIAGAEAEVNSCIEAAITLVVNGLKYGGDAPLLALDSAAKIGFYVQSFVSQAIVKSAKLAFYAL